MHSASSNSTWRQKCSPIGVKPNYFSNNSTVANSIGCERIRNCGRWPWDDPVSETVENRADKRRTEVEETLIRNEIAILKPSTYTATPILYIGRKKCPTMIGFLIRFGEITVVLLNTGGCFWFIAESIERALKCRRREAEWKHVLRLQWNKYSFFWSEDFPFNLWCQILTRMCLLIVIFNAVNNLNNDLSHVKFGTKSNTKS